MKKFKGLFLAIMMLFSTSAFAADFDWSQCWCNYGAGIKPGTMTADISFGINDNFFDPFELNKGWALPYMEAAFDVALPIWKLPFSWGGFFGTNIGGSKDDYCNYSMFFMNFGGQVRYHVLLPVDNLDVYAGVRLGAKVAVSKTDENGKVSKDYAGSGFYWSTFLGAHYYLNKTFGFVLEFGHPVWVKTGISLKF